MKRRIALLLLLLAGMLQGWAQRPFFRELIIDRQDDEIKVNTLLQSEEGFVYAGTNKGLFRYDGFEFKNISSEPKSQDIQITAMTSKSRNEIYSGSEKGEVIHWINQKPVRIPTPFHSPVKSLFFDENSTLWVATYGEGIFYRIKNIWHRMAGLPDPFIYTLKQHPTGKLLAGTDGGLVVINKQSNPVSYFVFNSRHGLPDNIVRSIGIMPNGEVLLGMQEMGICRFNLSTKKFVPVTGQGAWDFGSINEMILLQNEFWLGTENHGIVDYEFSGDRRLRNFSMGSDLPFSRVSALLRDTEGNVWVAGDNKLIISPGEKVEFVNEIAGKGIDSIQAITSCPDGYIWFSNPEGLYRFDYLAKDNERLLKYNVDKKRPHLHIVSLFEDDFENLWIGTFDNGLYCMNTATGDIRRLTEKDGLPNANVIAIHGRGENIWLATLGGVVECRRINTEGKKADFPYELKMAGPGPLFNGFVYDIYEDTKGRLWLGTDGKGLLMYDGKSIHEYSISANAKIVYSIEEDFSGNIWCSTQHNGIYRYDGKSFRNFNLNNGLSELDIYGISIDNGGNLLAINRKGIDIINSRTFSIENIGEESGLKELDADLNAVARDRKGGVWIGARNGIIRFYNYSLDTKNKPNLVIQRVLTFMKQDVGLKDTVFEYNQNNISIEYTGLWYSHPDLVTYRYRVKGYSNDWIPTRDRIVTFPNLPPGTYTFEVMAGLEGQFRHAAMASYTFHIRKALWKELWFQMTVVIFLAIIIILFIRDRDVRFRRMESLKKEKVEYQYATLKSQVNPHFLFNSFNTLIAIIENDAGKAIGYVEKLSDYFRNMVQHRDKDVISLEEELQMVETYYFLQQKRFGNALKLYIDIPDDWKHQFGLPPLSLQLLLENAVKHNAVSHESPLDIHVTAAENHSLIIRNNLNPKVKPEPSTGIGLNNIVNRFQILAGEDVRVESVGDEFIVKVPLIPIE
ncbi:MAG: two-component regulator propeller domain-containing protein [Bacteroidia bacterium]